MDKLGLFSHCQILCDYYASLTVLCNFVSPLETGCFMKKEKYRWTRLLVCAGFSSDYETLYALNVRQCMSSLMDHI